MRGTSKPLTDDHKTNSKKVPDHSAQVELFSNSNCDVCESTTNLWKIQSGRSLQREKAGSLRYRHRNQHQWQFFCGLTASAHTNGIKSSANCKRIDTELPVASITDDVEKCLPIDQPDQFSRFVTTSLVRHDNMTRRVWNWSTGPILPVGAEASD